MLTGFMLFISNLHCLSLAVGPSLVLILTKATRNKVSCCDHIQPQTVFGINDYDQRLLIHIGPDDRIFQTNTNTDFREETFTDMVADIVNFF